jgi:hypothetical protein
MLINKSMACIFEQKAEFSKENKMSRNRRKISLICYMSLGSFFALMISGNFFVKPCLGHGADLERGHFSMDIKRMDLLNVLNKIAKETGYKIEINQHPSTGPLTLQLIDVSMEEGLRKVLKNVSLSNYAFITDEKDRTLKIYVIGGQGSGDNNRAPLLAQSQGTADDTVSNPLGKALTNAQLAELKKAEDAKHPNTNPLGIGMTNEQLANLKKAEDTKQQNTNPLGVKVTNEGLASLKKAEDAKHQNSNPLGINISTKELNELKKAEDQKNNFQK